MFANIFGRPDNAKEWLKRFKNWDLDRKNKVVGSVALGQAVYMGPHRLELVKVLLESRASLKIQNYSGASALTSLCASEDCDPRLVKLLLKQFNDVNYRRVGKNLKWRNIYRLAKFLVKSKLSNSGLMMSLARASGTTALHYAVRRGDIDVVNVLLEHNANPEIKDDLGKSATDYCNAFPELRGALRRVIQQRQDNTKGGVQLHRRKSTATDLKYPMYLTSLEQLQQMYGGPEPKHKRLESHEVLLKRNELITWEDLPIDAHIIFVSHERVGWSHPDPQGIQIQTFLRVMKRLLDGEIPQVEMNVVHTMMYKTNRVVDAKEWKQFLSTA